YGCGLLTRAKLIPDDNLAVGAAEVVKEAYRLVARGTRALGFEADTENPVPPAFQPFRLRGLTLANRMVVSPMCQFSAQDGVPGDWHLVHYGSRAIGGAGLMFTEMTDVSEKARITHACPGMVRAAEERR